MKNHNKNEAILKPFCQLLESAEEITNRKNSDCWEVEVVKKINCFKLETSAGQAAVKEGWFGMIYDNYIVAPFGLANYLFDIFAKQIFIRDIWTIRPDAQLPRRPVDEFTYAQLHNFREWVDSKYFYAKAINGEAIDIIRERRDDLIILRKKGLERISNIKNI